jgi:hypothetical protein
VKFVRNEWRDLLRLCVSSGERIDTCNDCLMDFIGHINGVLYTNALEHNRCVPDQRRFSLGYLLDPS